jgi:FMN phosphatase YigB (HAD superfamily)
LLKQIHENGIIICIVSRREVGHIKENLIKEQNYIDCIKKIYYIGQDENKRGAYVNAMQKYKSTPQTTMIVGDYLEKDIEAAVELGCISVWFKNGKYSTLSPILTGIYPTHIIENLLELIQFVR